MKRAILLLFIIFSITNAGLALAEPNSFYQGYLKNKKSGVGSYITADFLLNSFYLYKKRAIEEIENKVLAPKLKEFSKLLMQKVLDSSTTDAKLIVYLATLNKLQNNTLPPLAKELSTQVDREIEKIDNASLPGYRMFNNNERIKDNNNYYRALIFTTQIPFYLNPSTMTHTDQNSSLNNLKRALFLAQTIKEDKTLKTSYLQINTTLRKLFGRGDDLSLKNFFTLTTTAPLAKLQQKLNKEINYPKIIGESIDISKTDLQDIYKNLLSFRIFATSFTVDSYAFSRLVYPFTTKPKSVKVDPYSVFIQGKRVRVLPSIEDIENIFTPLRKEPYSGYFNNIKRIEHELKKTLKANTLYSYDFLIYKTLIKTRKLNAFRGYYTQNRHLISVYAKKSQTPTARSVEMFRKQTTAYLERDLKNILRLMIKELTLLNTIYPNSNTQEYKVLLKKLAILATKKSYNNKQRAFLNNLFLKFKNLTNAEFEPISVAIHKDNNSNQELMQKLSGIKSIEYKKLNGFIYSHSEQINKKR